MDTNGRKKQLCHLSHLSYHEILQVLFHPQSEPFPTALCFSGALHPGDIITAMDGTTIEAKSRDGNRLGCPFSKLGLERVDMGGS